MCTLLVNTFEYRILVAAILQASDFCSTGYAQIGFPVELRSALQDGCQVKESIFLSSGSLSNTEIVRMNQQICKCKLRNTRKELGRKSVIK